MKLSVGQHVEILSHKGDWFKGRTEGNVVGLFPKYCVNLVKHKKRKHRAPFHTPKYVVALHSFGGHQEKELPFKKGTVIKVRRWRSDWCIGQLEDGSKGFFPRNYVKPLRRKRGLSRQRKKSLDRLKRSLSRDKQRKAMSPASVMRLLCACYACPLFMLVALVRACHPCPLFMLVGTCLPSIYVSGHTPALYLC